MNNKFFGLVAVLFITITTACGGYEGMAPMPEPSCPPPAPTAPSRPHTASEVCMPGTSRPCTQYCAFTRDYTLAGLQTCQDGNWSGYCRPNEGEESRCETLDVTPSRMIVDLDNESNLDNIVVIASDPFSSVNRPSFGGIVVNDAGQGTLDYMPFEGRALLIQDGLARPVILSDVVTSCGLYQGDAQLARALVSGNDLVFTSVGLLVADRFRPWTRFRIRCDYRLSPTVGLRQGGWIEARIGARTDGFRTREANGFVQGTLVLQQNSSVIGDTLITIITNDR